jgi:hypothetical protein
MQKYPEAKSKEKTWYMGPYGGVDYNLTLCSLDSNTFTMGSPLPEPTLTLCQSRLYTPIRDFGFCLRVVCFLKYGKTAGTGEHSFTVKFCLAIKGV